MQERPIHLLEAIAGAPSPIGIAALLDATRMPKATIYQNVAAFLARYRGGRFELIHVEPPSDPKVSNSYPGLGSDPALFRHRS
ncbi:helix-turn-helix domain-containing protein [Parasedimentitalea huanghaiensis]|uniref:HTH iclR-type domain-containing protein n=1 Tax=Parasedimentitalea huanghaiensis TaxID=2682100 RepID=A0A6L6WKV0_9RHOB|nr:helix-turn-helix domain-containing protein [Zongyanglinia huanghaiensis]MVO17768.1 hypothetical protein [Zongyanglinia huanghaiensis]